MLKACRGRVEGVSRVCRGCVEGVLKACRGRVEGVSRACRGRVECVSREQIEVLVGGLVYQSKQLHHGRDGYKLRMVRER